MIDTGSCPTQDDWQRLLARDCDAATEGRLRRHVAECAACFETLAALTPQVGEHSPSPAGPTPQFPSSSVVQHSQDESLADSQPPDATMADMTPPPVPQLRTPAKSSGAVKLDFLRPKVAPDELGRLGGYRVLSVLGKGGMGVVLKAEDVSLKRMVALKVMKPLLAAHETAGRRFIREAQSAASINHENVVRIYQVGEDNGVPFLAMELLEGETLDSLVRRAGRLSLAETLRIGRQVAAGLAAAHRRGLVHRDIKPANIVLEPIDPTEEVDRTVFLARSSGSGLRAALSDSGELSNSKVTSEVSSTANRSRPTKVKLVDFGLARATDEDSQLTQSGMVTGTPQYMSPEQAEGLDLDHRSDLFSLGCVLYRALAGEAPFNQKGNTALLRAIVERPHAPLRETVPNVPPDVEAVIDRLLAKKPEERFQTAVEVMEALGQLELRLDSGQLTGESAATAQATSSMTVYDMQASRADRPQPAKGVGQRVTLAAMGLLCLIAAVLFWKSRADRDPTNSIPHMVTPDRASDQPALVDATRAKEAPPDPTDSDQFSAIAIPEVQPLAEWLQGREIVTVSQDGKGQFRTIQAALDALKPNQVVKVLDRGPYRESLHAASVPKNTGLVSLVGTQLDVPEYQVAYKSEYGTAYSGILLYPVDGFRLSGFDIRTSQALSADASALEFVKVVTVGPFTVDHCRLWVDHSLIGQRGSVLFRTLTQLSGGTGQYTVRFSENEFRGADIYLAQLNSDPNRRPLVQLDRNQIREAYSGIGMEPRPGSFDIQHNVIAADNRGIGWPLRLGPQTNDDVANMSLNLSNNTITAETPIRVYSAATRETSASVPPLIRNVRIQRNILRSLTDDRITFSSADDLGLDDVTDLRDVWQVGHNNYIGGKSLPLNFPTQPTDLELPESPLPYNADPSDENYLRPFANSRLKIAGAGGGQPSYIGALPPGPSPKDGDWFSRLRSSWDVHSLRSEQVDAFAEVQPIEEWLKRREVLTVSQDGRGQFKSINEAMKKLKPGQVVQVLDQGPYRESLRLGRSPVDTGLVSLVGTKIEITELFPFWSNERGQKAYTGCITGEQRFRLHGFDFEATGEIPEDAGLLTLLKVVAKDHVTIEGCRFDARRLRQNFSGAQWALRTIDLTCHGSKSFRVEIVGNRFRGGSVFVANDTNEPTPRAHVVVARNHVSESDLGVRATGGRGTFVVRENVLDDVYDGIAVISRQTVYGHDPAELKLAIINNSIRARLPIVLPYFSEAKPILENVEIQGNLLVSTERVPILFAPPNDPDGTLVRETVLKKWTVSHNAYSSAANDRRYPKQNSDVEFANSPLPFVVNPADESYFRIDANGPLAKSGPGGEWPSYIGALPPGPPPKDGDWFTRLRGRWTSSVVGSTETRVDGERRAAEWVLRIGGSVKLAFPDGSVRPITAAKDLPAGDFVVDTIEVFANPRVTDADARRYLAGLSGLKSLQIHHTAITDATLEALRDSPTLGILHLEETAVTDVGIAALGRLPKLHSLMLNQTKVTADCLPALSAQPEIRLLNIGSIPASESAAKVLLAVPRWSMLGLHESWIQPEHVARMVEYPDLRTLNLYGDLPVSRLRLLASLPKLSRLQFVGHQTWSPEHAAGLSSLPQLDWLSLSAVKPPVGWKELVSARPWRELQLIYTHIPDEFFDGLDRVESLTILRLTQTTQSRSRLQRFRAEHPKIDVISDTSRPRDREVAERLLRLGGITVRVIDRRGEHHIPRLDALPDTEFDLWSVQVHDCSAFDDRMLASLVGLERLNGLNLTKSSVTDSGLTALDQLPSLTGLQIAAEQMTPRGLQAIARQPHLDYLSLPGVTAEQLKRLASLKLTLLAVDLAPEVGPDALQVITQQFPELILLDIGRFVPDAESAGLLLKLPRLQLLSGQSAMFTSDVVSTLARHPSLQSLKIYGTHPLPWVSLKPLQRLQTLLIGVNKLSDAHLERLAELPQLQTLTFDRCQFTPESLPAFTKLRHVAKVQFTDCKISDADWQRVVEALPSSELLWNGQPRKLVSKNQ